MKVRTSITLPDNLLKEVAEMIDDSGSRSAFFETAIREYIERCRKKMRDRTDLELINISADDLNKKAEEVLSYQVSAESCAEDSS